MGLWPVPPAGDAPPPPPQNQGLPPRSVFGSSPMEGDASRANNYFAGQRALQMAQTAQGGQGNVPGALRILPGTDIHGYPSIYRYQLVNPSGNPVTGDDISVKEHMSAEPPTGNIVNNLARGQVWKVIKNCRRRE